MPGGIPNFGERTSTERFSELPAPIAMMLDVSKCLQSEVSNSWRHNDLAVGGRPSEVGGRSLREPKIMKNH